MMTFKKGHKKLGGRSKGTPNKRSEDLLKACSKYEESPFEVLLRIAHGDLKNVEGLGIVSLELRFQAAKEICKYLYAKKRPVDEASDRESLPVRIFAFPDPKIKKQ